MLETPQRLRPHQGQTKRRQHTASSSSAANMHSTYALKEKLMREMLELNKQREDMEIGATEVDFSMLQTYKEMIQSRQTMLNQLATQL